MVVELERKTAAEQRSRQRRRARTAERYGLILLVLAMVVVFSTLPETGEAFRSMANTGAARQPGGGPDGGRRTAVPDGGGVLRLLGRRGDGGRVGGRGERAVELWAPAAGCRTGRGRLRARDRARPRRAGRGPGHERVHRDARHRHPDRRRDLRLHRRPADHQRNPGGADRPRFAALARRAADRRRRGRHRVARLVPDEPHAVRPQPLRGRIEPARGPPDRCRRGPGAAAVVRDRRRRRGAGRRTAPRPAGCRHLGQRHEHAVPGAHRGAAEHHRRRSRSPVGGRHGGGHTVRRGERERA